MERFQSSWQAAQRKLQVADHMLTMTYPLVNDPKLLLNIAANVADGMEAALSALLEFERLFKRVPPYAEDFDAKLIAFEQYILPERKIPLTYMTSLRELRDIIRRHQGARMEFIRDGKVVIADDKYRLRLLSPGEIKRHVDIAKDFLAVVRPVVTDERSAA